MELALNRIQWRPSVLAMLNFRVLLPVSISKRHPFVNVFCHRYFFSGFPGFVQSYMSLLMTLLIVDQVGAELYSGRCLSNPGQVAGYPNFVLFFRISSSISGKDLQIGHEYLL
jgi:hypothetical protein